MHRILQIIHKLQPIVSVKIEKEHETTADGEEELHQVHVTLSQGYRETSIDEAQADFLKLLKNHLNASGFIAKLENHSLSVKKGKGEIVMGFSYDRNMENLITIHRRKNGAPQSLTKREEAQIKAKARQLIPTGKI